MTICDDGTVVPAAGEDPTSDEFWASVALSEGEKFAMAAQEVFELKQVLLKIKRLGDRGNVYSQIAKDAINLAAEALMAWA